MSNLVRVNSSSSCFIISDVLLFPNSSSDFWGVLCVRIFSYLCLYEGLCLCCDSVSLSV